MSSLVQCLVREELCVKALSQSLHLYSFSPVDPLVLSKTRCSDWRVWNNHDTHRAFPQCVSFHSGWVMSCGWRISQIHCALRLFLGVNPLVFYEKGTLAEGTTFTTFIELLSCVAPPMLNEGSKLAVHRAFPHYEFAESAHAGWRRIWNWRISHIYYTHMDSHLCEFSGAGSVGQSGWMSFHTEHAHSFPPVWLV